MQSVIYSHYVLQELSDVGTWLNSLELQGYQQLFEAAGYKTRDDLENLIGLKRTDLQKMGIGKRGRLEQEDPQPFYLIACTPFSPLT